MPSIHIARVHCRHFAVARVLMLMTVRIAGFAAAVACVLNGGSVNAATSAAAYDAQYRAEVRPASGVIQVKLQLSGEKLPRQLVFSIDPDRHLSFKSTDRIDISDKAITWYPQGKISRLSYDFVVNHERSPGDYDSRLTTDWALFRADKMVPGVSVTAVRGLESRTTLEFILPAGWTATTPYPETGARQIPIQDPQRRFDRPEGWMLLGKLGKRSELIAGVQTIVAAPLGNSARRQDMLTFLNWNLPHLVAVFPAFPRRMLVTSAGDPMWRGGLSGPASLFIHSDRPLVSENRTSTLLHELVHVAMAVRGDEESDWIVEGFAEFYSIETLRRSGSIGAQRYREAMRRLQDSASRVPSLFGSSSSGATTARAVVTLSAADKELRSITDGKASLDDVARKLAARRGEVSLELLQSLAREVAGRPLKSLDRRTLSTAIASKK